MDVKTIIRAFDNLDNSAEENIGISIVTKDTKDRSIVRNTDYSVVEHIDIIQDSGDAVTIGLSDGREITFYNEDSVMVSENEDIITRIMIDVCDGLMIYQFTNLQESP